MNLSGDGNVLYFMKLLSHIPPRVRHWSDVFMKYIAPTLVSALLVFWIARKIDFHQMGDIIRHGVEWEWILVMVCFGTLSHIIRGVRWGIQLRGIGVRTSNTCNSVAIFGAYALDIFIPNSGEVWRCVFMARRGKAPLTKVVGTDIGDRLSDLAAIIVISVLAFVLALPKFREFMTHYDFGRDILRFTDSPWPWIVAALLIGGLWTAWYFFRNTRVMRKAEHAWDEIWNGFAVLFRMPQKWLYFWLTCGIWICYFMKTYTMFHAFGFTRELCQEPELAYGLLPGLVVFVFGSCSMAVPSNGGLGAWNIAVIFGLSLYGISQTEGATYSIVMWTAEVIAQLTMGLFSVVYIVRTRPRKQKSTAQGSMPVR